MKYIADSIEVHKMGERTAWKERQNGNFKNKSAKGVLKFRIACQNSYEQFLNNIFPHCLAFVYMNWLAWRLEYSSGCKHWACHFKACSIGAKNGLGTVHF
ncbi:hypothetical protein EGR_05023 [Echinococcus granulosus]|uniref:Uncharacterized protein n=1 Tax=Echinococcus granulosus TaxID=6210 RepID=W6UFH0_ECHGR|nr:hypothetical protein EGR_05023 [Echinococcus granulosus]EUB60170.1 hypothetical protein EGR_05023 [Echinococcus granulosus]